MIQRFQNRRNSTQFSTTLATSTLATTQSEATTTRLTSACECPTLTSTEPPKLAVTCPTLAIIESTQAVTSSLPTTTTVSSTTPEVTTAESTTTTQPSTTSTTTQQTTTTTSPLFAEIINRVDLNSVKISDFEAQLEKLTVAVNVNTESIAVMTTRLEQVNDNLSNIFELLTLLIPEVNRQKFTALFSKVQRS